MFICPSSIAIHHATGNIVVTDTGNHRVQVFNSFGKFLLKFGAWGKATVFSTPCYCGVAIDQITGQVCYFFFQLFLFLKI